ncbi:phage protein [Proteus mirabilis]|uniref:Phage protein n=1 Tax=Proteus mirabilis TaxID=584 RepID=A0A2X2BEZ5_PROMI|nr:phage protein [Proteus mirabilis]
MGETQQLTQLICTTSSAGKKQYRIGLQKISDAGAPLLVAIESYWRKNTQESCVLFVRESEAIYSRTLTTNEYMDIYVWSCDCF